MGQLQTVAASPVGGRHDKIMIDFENQWVATGSQEAFTEFRLNLAGEFPDESGAEYRLFNLPGDQRYPTIWKVSKGIVGSNGIKRTPLFSGRLLAKQLPTLSAEGLPQWHITAELSLNPTRWLTQQPIGLVRTPEEHWLATSCNMFHRGPGYSDTEHVLVRSDNVLIGPTRKQSLARRNMWMIQVERYLRGTLALIDRTLSYAANEAHGFAISSGNVAASLKQMETYWEFWSERPLEEMARLALPIQQMAASSSTN